MKNLPFFLIALIFLNIGCTSRPTLSERQVASDLPFPSKSLELEEDSDPRKIRVGARPDHAERSQFAGIYNNPDYTPLLDLVRYAQKTVDIEIYMMADKAFREELRRAMRRGVVVRVIKEPAALGESCKYFSEAPPSGPELTPDCLDQKALVKKIRERGEFVPFSKPDLCGKEAGGESVRCFQHGKLMIVDRDVPARRLALISTGNFNNSNLCVLKDNPTTCNRDFTYVTRDHDVIEGLVWVFEGDLSKVRYENVPSFFSQKVTVSPFSKEPLLEFIRSAKSRVQIENQYMKDKEVLEALAEMARRGVSVELMLASDCSFGRPKEAAKAALSSSYKELQVAGVKLRFFTSRMQQRGKHGYLHAKAIVVDNERAWVGSVNGSATSLDVNREYGIFFSHPKRVAYLSQILAKDFKHPRSETWQEAFVCKYDGRPNPESEFESN